MHKIKLNFKGSKAISVSFLARGLVVDSYNLPLDHTLANSLLRTIDNIMKKNKIKELIEIDSSSLYEDKGVDKNTISFKIVEVVLKGIMC